MTTTTQLRLALSVVLGAVLAALLIHAPVARSDANGFLDDMSGMGFRHADGASGLLRIGYAICQYLSTPGVTGLDAARQVYASTGWDIDREDSAYIVIASVVNLCPEYDRSGQSVA